MSKLVDSARAWSIVMAAAPRINPVVLCCLVTWADGFEPSAGCLEGYGANTKRDWCPWKQA